MTLQDLIHWLSDQPHLIISYYVILGIISLLGLLFIKRRNFTAPITYLYGGLMYAIAIPGVVAVLLVLYSVFLQRTNLLQLELITYFVPIIAMCILLMIIHKTVPISSIPGFGKFSGLLLMIGITCVITYIAQRLFFGVFFVGKFEYLIGFFLLLLIGVKIAWDKIIR